MTEQSRYRLTGAIFLVALALLVAPMLFDGDGLPAVAVDGLSPVEPMQPVNAPPAAFAESTFSELEQQSSALSAGVDDEGFDSTTQTQLGDVALAEPTPSQLETADASAGGVTQVWAVQAASFKKADNAVVLRDKLRKAGYESFLSTLKQTDEVWTRVVVGPFLDKSEAQRIASAVSSEFSLDAQLRTVTQ